MATLAEMGYKITSYDGLSGFSFKGKEPIKKFMLNPNSEVPNLLYLDLSQLSEMQKSKLIELGIGSNHVRCAQ